MQKPSMEKETSGVYFMYSYDQLNQMQLDDLAHQCAEERAKFFRKQFHDNRFCYELFRRALADGVEQAWELIYSQYSSLVAGWVKSHPLSQSCGEEVQYFINEAFERLWKACRDEKFARFSKLPQLLTYLKACVHGALSDYYRRKVEPFPQNLFINEVVSESILPPPHLTVLEHEQRNEFWSLLQKRLRNEKELLVIECCFALGLKPSEAYATYSQVFENQQEVYRVKDNLLRRLRRDDELKRFFEENA